MSLDNGVSKKEDQSAHVAVPTSRYTDAELAEIYNQARVDYIVPMPMNARRMREYIDHYDIDLDASMVAIDEDDGEPNGVCMLGIRDERTWITRLGVIPERRRRRAGQFLMDVMIDESRKRDKSLIQLEVIRGNEPAHRLFSKLGFEETRELLVIRRPPGALPDTISLPAYESDIMDRAMVIEALETRDPDAAWTEETSTLLQVKGLTGLHVHLASGEDGWVVYQQSSFQLTHFVFNAGASPEMLETLIAAVHIENPLQDTKIENLPSAHPAWTAYQKLGYHEAFGRIEMFLYLK